MIRQNHIGIREGRRRGRQWKSWVLEDVHLERLPYGALTVFEEFALLMHAVKRKQMRGRFSCRASKVFS